MEGTQELWPITIVVPIITLVEGIVRLVAQNPKASKPSAVQKSFERSTR